MYFGSGGVTFGLYKYVLFLRQNEEMGEELKLAEDFLQMALGVNIELAGVIRHASPFKRTDPV